MLNIELNDIRTIKWMTSTDTHYVVDFNDIYSPHMLLRPPQMKEVERKAIHTNSGVDLRLMCSEVKNQGDLGTCGACALTGFLEVLTGTSLSVLFIYYVSRVYICNNLPHDDAGVELKDCLEALLKYGICRAETWRYDTAKFLATPPQKAFDEALKFHPTDFARLNTLADMKASLKKEIPIFVDINFAPGAYGREPALTGHIGKPPITEVEYCDHTVLLVGYDDDTDELIFQNSWGKDWGEKGYGRFSYEYITRGLFKNAYTWVGEKVTSIIVD